MATKILFLTCSPRAEGNTNCVVRWAADGAVDAGAEVEIADAANLKYKANGCTSCMGCQKSDQFRCVIKDEASELVARVPDFDVLVFATPVYWFNMTAQMKMILDRMYSLVKMGAGENEVRHAFTGMSLGLIATAGGGPDAGLNQVDELCKDIAHFFMDERYDSMLVPFCDPPEETVQDGDLKERAIEYGRRLAAHTGDHERP